MAGNTDPITDERLAELDRLRAEATPGELQSRGYRLSHTANRRIDYSVEHVDEIGQIGTGPYQAIPFARVEDAKWHAAVHNAYPALRARLAEAEREREERRIQAGRAQEALRFLMNGLPANDAVWAAYGNADSARAWLAARDAQQRREGAAEWFAEHRDYNLSAMEQMEKFTQAAKRLRESD